MKTHFVFSVLIAVGLWSCEGSAPAHQHADEHVSGHDHHAAEHGHAGASVHRATGWGNDVEVFAEYTPRNEQASELLLYLTKLSDFTPYEGASLRVVWRRDSEKGGAIADEIQPGIYRAYLPSRSDARLDFQVESDGKTLAGLDGLAFRDPQAVNGEVEQSSEEAHPGPHQDHHDQGEVELLKAQQWSVPFGTQRVTQASVSETREVLAQVEIPSGSIAEVGAPVAGRVLAPRTGFPEPGTVVKSGQILARIAPTLMSADHVARLDLELAQARARFSGAKAEFERAQRLFAEQATSRRAVEDAKRELEVAEQALKSAQKARAIFSKGPEGSIPVSTPLSGTITAMHVRVGESVEAGHFLFRVSDPKETWLRVHIPAGWIGQFHETGDFLVWDDTSQTWQTFHVVGDGASASMLSVGSTVDPKSQTVDVLYSVRDNGQKWFLGATKRVQIPVGDKIEGIVIPRSAVLRQEGRAIAYVQIDGEHFIERVLHLGPSQGDDVLVLRGLSEGERVVTRGAAIIRFAADSNQPAGHGHLH